MKKDVSIRRFSLGALLAVSQLAAGCSANSLQTATHRADGAGSKPGAVVVPDIEGQYPSDADEMIRRAGLLPTDTPVYGPTDADAAGFSRAYRQIPRPGTKVPKGSIVNYRWWWETS